jgi:Domain of unknown function (DUF4338)
MDVVLRHQGRAVTLLDVEFIRALIAAHPEASRRKLSELLCEAWNWRQRNGALRAMVCRGLMLALHRAGYIELPPVKQRQKHNPLVVRCAPEPVEVDSTPLYASLHEIEPVSFRQVRRTPQEAMFNSLMHAEHYLGYAKPVGESLKFVAYSGSRPVALFAWSSAPRHLAARDRYIGWSPEQRRRHIDGVAYNTRYLIPSWVHVPHLASHLLARMTRMLSLEWERAYGHGVYFAETFVDTSRHRGTCYRAANWVFLGRTTGRGKNDQTGRPNRTLKDVLGLPLRDDFREKLLNAP